jgi:hypothetical protein
VKEKQPGGTFYRARRGGEWMGDDGQWSELKTSVIGRQAGKTKRKRPRCEGGLAQASCSSPEGGAKGESAVRDDDGTMSVGQQRRLRLR